MTQIRFTVTLYFWEESWGRPSINKGVTIVASILVVDDDRKLTDFLSDRLGASGYDCKVVPDGERALELLASEAIDLLVLDVMIPGISGFEVCRRIRSEKIYHGIPVLFMSSMNSEEEIAHALAQGADDFLPKPFHADTLLQRVGNLLAMGANNTLTDGTTGLLSAKGIKLEIHRALNLREPIALAYIELLNNVEFGQALGEDKRAKALRHFARTLHISAEEVKPRSFRVGHLGGGHFLSVITPKRMEKWSKTFGARWDKHLRKFYKEVAGENSFEQAAVGAGRIPMLETLVCYKHCEPGPGLSANELLETLSNLRTKAITNDGAGIYEDRRH